MYEYCIRVWGDTIFPTGIPFSLVNNVWGIQYSRGYRIHYDTCTRYIRAFDSGEHTVTILILIILLCIIIINFIIINTGT